MLQPKNNKFSFKQDPNPVSIEDIIKQEAEEVINTNLPEFMEEAAKEEMKNDFQETLQKNKEMENALEENKDQIAWKAAEDKITKDYKDFLDMLDNVEDYALQALIEKGDPHKLNTYLDFLKDKYSPIISAEKTLDNYSKKTQNSLLKNTAQLAKPAYSWFVDMKNLKKNKEKFKKFDNITRIYAAEKLIPIKEDNQKKYDEIMAEIEKLSNAYNSYSKFDEEAYKDSLRKENGPMGYYELEEAVKSKKQELKAEFDRLSSDFKKNYKIDTDRQLTALDPLSGDPIEHLSKIGELGLTLGQLRKNINQIDDYLSGKVGFLNSALKDPANTITGGFPEFVKAMKDVYLTRIKDEDDLAKVEKAWLDSRAAKRKLDNMGFENRDFGARMGQAADQSIQLVSGLIGSGWAGKIAEKGTEGLIRKKIMSKLANTSLKALTTAEEGYIAKVAKGLANASLKSVGGVSRIAALKPQ